MYKCRECGHSFSEDDVGMIEENHFLDGYYAGSEYFTCCPECHGDYDDATICCECGEVFSDDEIYDGWCKSCLAKTINYDTFFEYCEFNKEQNYLDVFVMCYLLGSEEEDVPESPSFDFHELMIEVYKKRVEKARHNEKVDGFLDACIQFAILDDGYVGASTYSEWLRDKIDKEKEVT